MNRRKFLLNSSTAGVALGASGAFISACSNDESSSGLFAIKHTMEKVVLAMLSMQRAPWEQGVAMQALLEMGEKELVILMAKDAVLRQSEDGRMAMLGGEYALTDAASPGEAVLFAANETGDEKLNFGVEKLHDYILKKAPRNKDGIIYHFTNVPQIWSDSNYMLPPFLSAVGEYKEAIKQINGIRDVLWNPEKQLFSHMWDCEKNTFVREACWGVGNGWTAAGYSRVINALPPQLHEERQQLVKYTSDLLDGCLEYLRSDGFFHDIIDDPDSFVETNLSQQLAYTIFKGVKAGWLDKKYLEKAELMRRGALTKVDELGLVQDVCGSPHFDHPGTATEGQVFHILMEVAFSELDN